MNDVFNADKINKINADKCALHTCILHRTYNNENVDKELDKKKKESLRSAKQIIRWYNYL